MKFPIFVLASMVVLLSLGACSPAVEEPSLTAVEIPATEAVPTSAPETESSFSEVTTVDSGENKTEEQAVLSAFSQPPTVDGELLVLYGHVLDTSGVPVSGAAVEIWQVDANGSYDHPRDPNTGSRDLDFQFYGTSITDENGLYSFRTLIPARYEPRPRHIHFIVKMDGGELITSQFYFAEDLEASQIGPTGEMLLLSLTEAQDGAGNAVMLAFKDIVVGSDGELSLTPQQQEGPYYPVVDLSGFDNDLANAR